MDKRVRIHGTNRADMNGKCGVATDFHWYPDSPDSLYPDGEGKWRYTVELDSGESFKLKPTKVRVVGAGGRGGGGGGTVASKAKGRGKKGRGGRK